MDNDDIIVGVIIIGIISFSILGSSYLMGEIQKIEEERNIELRNNNTPTSYECDVLSVTYHEAWFWSENYYKIVYRESNGIVTRLKIDEDKIQVIYSLNDSKLIIENPESNGYPRKYILYWDFQELVIK